MFELYIGNKNYSSWSLRPWILMQTRNIPFQEHLVPFDEHTSFTKFRAFSPSGKVPCLIDGTTVVWDSLGIAEYLAEATPSLWPAERTARAWARCATAEMHSGFGTLRQVCTMNIGIRVRLYDHAPALRADVARIAELWNEGLARFGGPYLAGPEFTIVDAFYAPVAFRVRTYALELSGAARDYAQRLIALPAMLKWERAALAEPWREVSHELEVAASGEIVQDLRQTARDTT